MYLKSFISSIAVMALFACSDSGTASNTGLSSNSEVGDFDYGTMTVSIEGKDFTVDTVSAVAPIDVGSDSGVASLINKTMYLTAGQHNGNLDNSELMLIVKDPKVGDNVPGGLTSLEFVYSQDSTRLWLPSDEGTVTITSIDKSGVKGSYDLKLRSVCYTCEADSVLHVTGEFDMNFKP